MSILTQASRQWASRPADERFTSLVDMMLHFGMVRSESREVICSSRRITAVPTLDNRGLEITGPNGHAYAPTHWSFGQLANLAGAPAGYLRKLPSPMAADCINYGLQVSRDVADVGVLLQKNGSHVLRAATGPKYGRIWNYDVVSAMVDRFGDGINGAWRVPGEFGKRVDVTTENTTLYASDEDMFIFLADEENRVEIPNRRHGQSGSLARGFFVWNSETGGATFGVKSFLFDYVCCNRIVWGASEVEEFKIRHTASAPVRFLEEITPALQSMARSSQTSVVAAIEDARSNRLDNVGDFLAKRYGPRVGARIELAHVNDEGRPIETRWDVVTGVTAYARSIPFTADRIELETDAGKLLQA